MLENHSTPSVGELIAMHSDVANRALLARKRSIGLRSEAARLRYDMQGTRGDLEKVVFEAVTLWHEVTENWPDVSQRLMASYDRHMIESVRVLRCRLDEELTTRRQMLGALLKAADDTETLLRANRRKYGDLPAE